MATYNVHTRGDNNALMREELRTKHDVGSATVSSWKGVLLFFWAHVFSITLTLLMALLILLTVAMGICTCISWTADSWVLNAKEALAIYATVVVFLAKCYVVAIALDGIATVLAGLLSPADTQGKWKRMGSRAQKLYEYNPYRVYIEILPRSVWRSLATIATNLTHRRRKA